MHTRIWFRQRQRKKSACNSYGIQCWECVRGKNPTDCFGTSLPILSQGSKDLPNFPKELNARVFALCSFLLHSLAVYGISKEPPQDSFAFLSSSSRFTCSCCLCFDLYVYSPAAAFFIQLSFLAFIYSHFFFYLYNDHASFSQDFGRRNKYICLRDRKYTGGIGRK